MFRHDHPLFPRDPLLSRILSFSAPDCNHPRCSLPVLLPRCSLPMLRLLFLRRFISLPLPHLPVLPALKPARSDYFKILPNQIFSKFVVDNLPFIGYNRPVA